MCSRSKFVLIDESRNHETEQLASISLRRGLIKPRMMPALSSARRFLSKANSADGVLAEHRKLENYFGPFAGFIFHMITLMIERRIFQVLKSLPMVNLPYALFQNDD